MKRILIFSLAYFPHVGGAEIAIKEITDRISDMEFHMITLNFGGQPRRERIGNVEVHRIGNGASYLGKMLFVLRAPRLARELHRTYRFDVFWAMMAYMLFPIVLASLHVPYVLTLQEGDPFEHVFDRLRILPVRPLLRRGFREASAVTAISNFLATWARYVGYKGAVDLVPNGADLARFSLPGQSHTDGIRLVTTSRLVHKNAIDDVIRALPLLPAQIEFVIYGIGPEEHALRKLAKKIGVENRLHFMGYLDHSKLPEALAACDIFIRPSRSEGMGISFVEAMAAGLPVIATQEGGIADFLFDAKRNPDKQPTGWAVDTDSPEQIADTIKAILANPEEVEKVKANAKKLVTERYDWNHVALLMRAVFERSADGSTMRS